MCDEGGVQESNLTKEERVGLKTLKKRVGEGEIVVCSTDKSSRFAVMTMEEYILAGQKHVGKDREVDMEFVGDNEKIINGHISMLLKTFMVGATWSHEGRHRATKINNGLAVSPMYLLYKDHKNWTVEMGGVPPTRPVCSAGGGQNDHLSETVSQLLEPVANAKETGMEVTSTQDMVSLITDINNRERQITNDDLKYVDDELDAMEREMGMTIFNDELEEIDKVLDTESNWTVCRELLLLRWEDKVEAGIRDAVRTLSDGNEDALRERMLDWLADKDRF